MATVVAGLVVLGLPACAAGDGLTGVPTPPGTTSLLLDVQPLIQALSAPDPAERIRAAIQLSQLGEAAKPAVPALIRLLEGRNLRNLSGFHVQPKVPELAAGTALRRLGKHSLPEMERLFADAPVAARVNLLWVLSGMSGLDAVPLMLRASKDPEPSVRSAAYLALSPFSDARVMETRIAGLQDPDSSARKYAASSFYAPPRDQNGDPRSYTPEERRRLTRALVPLLKDAEMRREVIASLGRVGSGEAAQALVPSLEEQDRSMRHGVLMALREIHHPAAVPALIRALKQEGDGTGTALTALALGDTGDPRATLPLTALFRRPEREVRANAAYALGVLGDRNAVPALREALEDEDRTVRVRAADALGKLRDPRAMTGLLRLLEGDQPLAEAVAALGEIGDPLALLGLIRILFTAAKDQNDLIEAAGVALGKIKSVELVPRLATLVLAGGEGRSGVIARTLIGERVGEGRAFAHDQEALARWWERHKAEYPLPEVPPPPSASKP